MMKKLTRGAWCLMLGAGVSQAETVEFRDYDAKARTFAKILCLAMLTTATVFAGEVP